MYAPLNPKGEEAENRESVCVALSKVHHPTTPLYNVDWSVKVREHTHTHTLTQSVSHTGHHTHTTRMYFFVRDDVSSQRSKEEREESKRQSQGGVDTQPSKIDFFFLFSFVSFKIFRSSP